MDFQEYLLYLLDNIQDPNNLHQGYKKSFDAIDSDNSGQITKQQLKESFAKVKEDITSEELDQLFEDADIDKDGVIDFNDYLKLMATKWNLFSGSPSYIFTIIASHWTTSRPIVE